MHAGEGMLPPPPGGFESMMMGGMGMGMMGASTCGLFVVVCYYRTPHERAWVHLKEYLSPS